MPSAARPPQPLQTSQTSLRPHARACLPQHTPKNRPPLPRRVAPHGLPIEACKCSFSPIRPLPPTHSLTPTSLPPPGRSAAHPDGLPHDACGRGLRHLLGPFHVDRLRRHGRDQGTLLRPQQPLKGNALYGTHPLFPHLPMSPCPLSLLRLCPQQPVKGNALYGVQHTPSPPLLASSSPSFTPPMPTPSLPTFYLHPSLSYALNNPSKEMLLWYASSVSSPPDVSLPPCPPSPMPSTTPQRKCSMVRPQAPFYRAALTTSPLPHSAGTPSLGLPPPPLPPPVSKVHPA
jgi:hypothetical protein